MVSSRSWRLRLHLLVNGLLFSLMLGPSALAQEVEASVDASQLVLGEQVTLTISVSGGTPSSPQMPQMSDFTVRYAGQETSLSIVNFNSTRTVRFNYLLTPQRKGVLTIPPIPVRVDGKTLMTNAVGLQVSGRSASGGAGSSQEPGAPASGATEDGDDILVEVELEPRNAVVGQLVTQTLRIFYGVPLAGDIQTGRAPIPGTLEENLTEPIQRRGRDTRGGRTYQFEEVTWLFYPVTSGTLEIPPLEVTVPMMVRQRRRSTGNPFFDGFMGMGVQMEPRRFQVEPQTVEVRPVPLAGRPDNFGGLVGKFELSGFLSASSVPLGESATLTVALRGRGNVRNFELPAYSSADFKTYDDTPTLGAQPDGDSISGEKVFKRAIVPQRSGTLTVPPLEVSYYDPETGRFERATVGPFPLEVTAAAGGATTLAPVPGSSTPTKQAVKVTGDDILPLHVGPELETRRYLPLTSVRVVGALVLPPVLFGMGGLLRRLRARRYSDPVQMRRRDAYSKAMKALREVKGKEAVRERNELDLLSRLFRTFLGDKLNVEGAALMAREARSQLEASGVAPPLAVRVESLIDRLERARYAPEQGKAQVKPLMEEARGLLKELERVLE